MNKTAPYSKLYEDIMRQQQTATGKRRMALARIGVAYEDVRSRARARITTREELYVWQLYFNRLTYDLAAKYHLTGAQVEEYLARNYGTRISSIKNHIKKRKEGDNQQEPIPQKAKLSPELLQIRQLFVQGDETEDRDVIVHELTALMSVEVELPKRKKKNHKRTNNLEFFTIPAETMEPYTSTLKARLVGNKLKGLMPYLRQYFADEELLGLIDRYRLGCLHKDRIVYPFFDIEGRLRIMRTVRYDDKGKRTKNGISSAHGFLKGTGVINARWKERPCVFGEHLLTEYPDCPVAIVSSEKLAIVCALLVPSCIWLATGGDSHIKEVGLIKEHLNRRTVYMLPSKGQYKHWCEETKRYQVKGMVLNDMERMSNKADIVEQLLGNKRDTRLKNFDFP